MYSAAVAIGPGTYAITVTVTNYNQHGSTMHMSETQEVAVSGWFCAGHNCYIICTAHHRHVTMTL